MPRRRFTLIEMLIVIAIIAILASLLAPSLRRSLRAAHAIGCVNNLRQIGVWALGYTSDWHGFLPIHNLNVAGQPVTDDSVYTYAYDWVKVMQDDGLVPAKNHVLGDGVLSCRELLAAHGGRMTPSSYTSYGLNVHMGGKIVEDSKKKPLPAARERLLSGKAFWFGDGAIYKHDGGNLDGKPHLKVNHWGFGPTGTDKVENGPWCWGGAGLNDPLGDPLNPGYGHTGAMDCNFVFGDGHAKSVGYYEFYGTGNTSDLATKLWRNHFLFGRDY